jgi:hypothetical protein
MSKNDKSIQKLENIIKDFKKKLLPFKPTQFIIMSAPYYRKIAELKKDN